MFDDCAISAYNYVHICFPVYNYNNYVFDMKLIHFMQHDITRSVHGSI